MWSIIIGIGLLLIILGAHAHKLWWEQSKSVSKGNYSTIEELGRVRIASELFPRFDPLVTGQSTIYIVGHDGAYASSGEKGRAWIGYLESWLSKGAVINYILTRPRIDAIKAMEELINHESGCFKLYPIFPQDIIRHPQLKDFVADFLEFHPTLLQTATMGESGDVTRAMWVERFHEVGKTDAYRVKFVPPLDAAVDEKFDEYLERFQSVIELTEARKSVSQKSTQAA